MTQTETIKISKEAEALSKEIKEKLSACKVLIYIRSVYDFVGQKKQS